jgi:hypothetical protein
MLRILTIAVCLCWLSAPAFADDAKKETDCANGKDDDGDSMTDCADADCHDDPACKSGQGAENTDAKCSDWVDNDGDGLLDCDDPDCEAPGIQVCKGSWGGVSSGGSKAAARAAVPATSVANGMNDEGIPLDAISSMGDSSDFYELIGKFGDVDGERNDEVCADGIDNDGDGRTDCADFGCRFDPEVTVCRGNPGLRMGVVSMVDGGRLSSTTSPQGGTPTTTNQYTTQFAKLQLTALGPIALIQNSFFLLSMRMERTPRLSFAMFQMPLGNGGHFLNLNSGGGGLSAALITSTSKQLLIDPAAYMYRAFEQANGAALEAYGPLTAGNKLTYRVFIAGGSGQSTGSVGGTYIKNNDTSYTYGMGAQLGINLFGVYNRFDTPFLYTPVPMTLAFLAGVKWDQRAQERYPAMNVLSVLRWNRLMFQGELYGKRDIDYNANSVAYNAQVGVLVVPKWLMLAADFGAFLSDPLQNVPASATSSISKQLDEQQWRVAAHMYVWRNIGILSLVYRDRAVQGDAVTAKLHERELFGNLTFRF